MTINPTADFAHNPSESSRSDVSTSRQLTSYSGCDDGLVCNAAFSRPICEKPNLHGLGGPCSVDQNCQPSLWCEHTNCVVRLQEGEACPSGFGCAEGLYCAKDLNATACVRPEQ